MTKGTLLNILMLSPQFRPIVGGYERAAERLSLALAAQGHTITIVTERRNQAWPAREEFSRVKIRRLWCRYRPHLHMLTSVASFAWFLLSQGRHFQVWHIHQYGHHAALAVVLGKLLRRPVVLKLTNTKDHGLLQTINKAPLAKVVKILLQRVDAVVALTRETQQEAVEFGIPVSRIRVLGNGVDINLYHPRNSDERTGLRCKCGIDATGLVIFVGRLAEEKNPDGLLQAWQIALKNLPYGWKLVLVGDGSMRAGLLSIIKTRRLESSVILVGQQDNVDDWFGAADIYLLASHNEGLSNALLEAMASGLPAVSTRVSGSTEILEETGAGFVVEVGKIEQLAAAIVRLIREPVLRRQMGQVARRVIENNYSIVSVALGHERLYRDLLAPKSKQYK